MPALNIFISHKHEDNAAAQAIRNVLTTYGGNQIGVFLSSGIPFGDNWREAIQRELIKCNLLLLLFTDKTASWDWCLYEAGMFTRLDDISYKRVICLHSPDLEEPPGPLKHLQAIKATIDKIAQFLMNLYRTDTYSPDSPLINSTLGDDIIRAAAKEIHSYMVKRPRDSQQLTKHILLHIQDMSKISTEHIDPDAGVVADQASLELFNRRSGRWRWKDIEDDAKKNSDGRWISQLAMAIYRASRRESADPVLAKFTAKALTTKDSYKTYQPILNSVEWGSDGSMKFEVLFNEDVSWHLPDIPENLAALQTAQHYALRFRYEVLRKFASRLEVRVGDSLREILSGLWEVIHSIEQEATSRGLMEEHKLLGVFDQSERSKLEKMYRQWYEIRTELQVAITKLEIDKVKQCLSILERCNKEFIPMAARRYEELMAAAMREEGTIYCQNRRASLKRLTNKFSQNNRRGESDGEIDFTATSSRKARTSVIVPQNATQTRRARFKLARAR